MLDGKNTIKLKMFKSMLMISSSSNMKYCYNSHSIHMRLHWISHLKSLLYFSLYGNVLFCA